MMLSIVILTWNTKDYLVRCINSITKHEVGIEYEIIVVDNGSSDGTESTIKSLFPAVKYIRNENNLGTSERNKGIKIANGKYIAFIDSDIEIIEDNTFSKIISYMEPREDVGITAPKLILSNGEMQYSCKEFLKFYTPILRRLDFLSFIRNTKAYKKQIMSDWDHNEIKQIDYAVSAFWIFRKILTDKIGMLDEKIFYAPEDVDYCLRARQGGFKVVYYPNIKVKHYYQRITRKIFSRLTLEHVKGLFYYFWKHKYLIHPKI